MLNSNHCFFILLSILPSSERLKFLMSKSKIWFLYIQYSKTYEALQSIEKYRWLVDTDKIGNLHDSSLTHFLESWFSWKLALGIEHKEDEKDSSLDPVLVVLTGLKIRIKELEMVTTAMRCIVYPSDLKSINRLKSTVFETCITQIVCFNAKNGKYIFIWYISIDLIENKKFPSYIHNLIEIRKRTCFTCNYIIYSDINSMVLVYAKLFCDILILNKRLSTILSSFFI